MTDTPYTLKAMALADAMAAWTEVACINPSPDSVECYKAAREALLTHLRAAQAVPEDERAARLALADRDWIGPEGQRMSAAVYQEWAPEEPERAALYHRAGAKT